MADSDNPQPAGHAKLWRAATIICLIVIAFGVATGMSMFEQFSAQIQHLQGKLKDSPQIKFIAVLLDDKQNPAMLVTQDPQEGVLQLQRLNEVKEGREDSMQLWTVPAKGKPVSLGILTPAIKTLRLPANEKTLSELPELAISVESKGGVTDDQGPRLPYLLKGVVIQKAL
jgi:anti-sigma-K factor RskA